MLFDGRSCRVVGLETDVAHRGSDPTPDDAAAHLGAVLGKQRRPGAGKLVFASGTNLGEVSASCVRAKAAAVQYLLADSHQQLPFRLFELLRARADVSAEAGHILRVPTCMRDPFTVAHLQRFESQEQLASAASLAELACSGVLAHTDIAAIECRHAQIRRVTQLQASAATHTKSLEACSADFVFMRQRLLSRASASPGAGQVNSRRAGRPPLQAKKVVKKLSQSAQNIARRAKRKGRRGGGGSWRAFLQERLEGLVFPKTKAEWAPIRKEYRHLTDKEEKRLLRRGRFMSFAYRLKPSGQRRSRQSVLPTTVRGQPPARAGQLCSQVHQRQELQRQQGEADHQQREAQGQRRAATATAARSTNSLQTCSGGSLLAEVVNPAALSSLRRRLRLDSRARQTAESKRLRADSERLQKSQVAEISSLLAGDADAFAFVPTPSDLHFLARTHNIAILELCPLVASMLKHALPILSTTCKEQLARAWRSSHDLIRHTALAPLSSPPPPRQLCRIAGMCLCGGRGARLKAFEGSLTQSLRRLFPTKSRPRLLLEQGMLVIRLHSSTSELFFHVAYANFTPWHLVLLNMDRADSGLLEQVYELVLTADGAYRWALTWSHLQQCDLDVTWSCEVLMFLARPGRCRRTLQPGCLLARPYLPTFTFWARGAPQISNTMVVQPVAAGGTQQEASDAERAGPVPIPAFLEEVSALLGVQEVAAEAEQGRAGVAAPIVSARRRTPAQGDAPASSQCLAPPDRAESQSDPLPGGAASSSSAMPPPPAGPVAAPPPAVEAPPPPPLARQAVRASDARRAPVDPYPRLYHPCHLESFVRLVLQPDRSLSDVKAFCGCHPTCTVTRTLKAGRRTGQGRPMGLLWAWLGTGPHQADKVLHMERGWPTHQQRLVARAQLEAMPEARAWLEAEAPPLPGDPREPPRIL